MPFAMYSGQSRMWHNPQHPLAVYFNVPQSIRQLSYWDPQYQPLDGQWLAASILKCPAEPRSPFVTSSWVVTPFPDYTVSRWVLPDLTYYDAWGPNGSEGRYPYRLSWTIESIVRPATQLCLADKYWGVYWAVHDQGAPYDPAAGNVGFPWPRHPNSRVTVLLADGHVQPTHFYDLRSSPLFYDMQHVLLH